MQSMAQEKVYIPEVLEPDERLPADLLALRRFAVLMDEAVRIPGTNRRVGLDAGIGLIPGVGDVVSAILSTWIIAGAIRHRVPFSKIMRMLFNVAVDLLVGEIPLLGDVFDFVYEQNVMNMRILMTHRNRKLPPRSTASIAAAVVVLFIIILGFAFAATAGFIALVIWITEQRLT
jgi:hypothetical protein